MHNTRPSSAESYKRDLSPPFSVLKRPKSQGSDDKYDIKDSLSGIGVNRDACIKLVEWTKHYRALPSLVKLINFLPVDDRASCMNLFSEHVDFDRFPGHLRFMNHCAGMWEELSRNFQVSEITMSPSMLYRLILRERRPDLHCGSAAEVYLYLLDVYDCEARSEFMTLLLKNLPEIKASGSLVESICSDSQKKAERLCHSFWRPLLVIVKSDLKLSLTVCVTVLNFLSHKHRNLSSNEGGHFILMVVKHIVADFRVGNEWYKQIIDTSNKLRTVLISCSTELLQSLASFSSIEKHKKLICCMSSLRYPASLLNVTGPCHVQIFCKTFELWPLIDTASVPDRCHIPYDVIFVEALTHLKESEAQMIIERLSLEVVDTRTSLADILLSVFQKNINGRDFTLKDPIKFLPQSDPLFCEIKYPELLALRGSTVKGPAVEQMQVFIRPCMSDCFKKIEAEFKAGANYVELEGPPGIGKSIAIAHWSQQLASSGSSVCWISLIDQATVIFMRPSICLHVIMDVSKLVDVLNCEVHCDLTVIDGVTATNCNHIIEAAVGMADRHKTKIVFCRSEGTGDLKEAPSFSLTGWTLDEYRTASKNPTFLKPFLNLLANDAELDSSLQLREALETNDEFREEIIQAALDDVIDSKFAVAGGNARYFFAFDSSTVKRKIDSSLRRIFGTVREPSLQAVNLKVVNSIFTRSKCLQSDFVSRYAAQRFVDLQSEVYAQSMWQYTKHLTHSAIGSVFQFLAEKQVRNREPFKVLQEGRLSEHWPVESFTEYYSARIAHLEPPVRVAIQNGLIERNGNSFTYDCRNFRSIISLRKYICSQRKNRSKQRNSLKFMTGAQRVFSGKDLRALELIDIRTNQNAWILTMKVNEPVLDMIRIVSETEAWILQLTISDKHAIADYSYIQEMQDVLTGWLPKLKLNFAVIVPKNKTFSYTSEQKSSLDKLKVKSTWFSVDEGPLAVLLLD